MKFYLAIFLLLFVNDSFAQSKVDGYWLGEITQDEGGIYAVYNMELDIKQEGDKIIGTSHIYVGEIFVVMSIEGTIYGDIYVSLKDQAILRDKKTPDLFWCIKDFQLILKKLADEDVLEGHWQGKTEKSGCIPGKVKLVKTTKRA